MPQATPNDASGAPKNDLTPPAPNEQNTPGYRAVSLEKWGAVHSMLTAQYPQYSAPQLTTMTDNAFRLKIASDMVVRAGGLKQIFERMTPSSTRLAPDVTGYVATKQDLQLADMASGSTDFLHSIYGGDAAAPFLETFLDPDPVRRAKTQDLLQQLADIPQQYVGRGTGSVNEATQRSQLEDILGQDDPVAAFQALPPVVQQALHQTIASLLATSAPVEKSLNTTVKVLKTENYSLSLSDSDVRNISAILRFAQGTTGPLANTEDGQTNDLAALQDQFKQKVASTGHANVDEAALNRMVGIDQYRAINGGVLVIDKEWAQEHPDKAVALHIFLEQRFPDVTIQVGRQGVTGSFLDSWGRVIDRIAAPVAGVIRQGSELVEALDFGPFANHTEAMKLRLAQLKKARDEGRIPESRMAQANTDIYNLEEDLNTNIGFSTLLQGAEDTRRSEAPGIGFGHVFTQSMGIEPGDNGYEGSSMVSGVVSQMVFDPTNLLFPFVKALEASRFVARTAQTVDELPKVEDLTKAIMEADRAQQAEASLSKLKGVTGTRGKLVDLIDKWTGYKPISEADAAKMAERMHDWQVKQIEAYHGLVPEVGGWLTNRIYAGIAKTPDEMAVSKPFLKQYQLINELRTSGISEDAFVSATYRVFGRDKALLLARAQNEADVMDIMIRTMTGGDLRYGISAYTDSMLLERSEIMNKLREGPKLQKEADSLSRQIDELGRLMQDPTWARLHEGTLTKLEDDYRTAQEAADRFAQEATDLKARKVWLDDVIKGKNWDSPKQVATPRDLKRIRSWHDAQTNWDRIAEDVIANTPNKDVSPRTWTTYKRMFENMGFGHEVIMEGPGSTRSIEMVRRWLSNMGLHEGDINSMLARWVDKSLDGDYQAQFEFWNDLWTKAWDKSNMPSTAIEKMRVHYTSQDGVRSAAHLEEGPLGYNPSRYDRTLVDENGVVRKGEMLAGKPVNSATEKKIFTAKLPTLDEMFQLRGFTARHLADMEKAGLTQKAIAKAAGLVSKGYEGLTEVWKTMVLVPRLFGAIPMRIFGEQQFRMAGYGRLFLFSHPSEWFGSLGAIAHMSTSELRLFAESPTHLLGSVVENFAREGKLVKTSDVLKIGDEGYSNSVNVALNEWLDSPEFNLWIRDNMEDPEAWLAAMNEPGNPYRHALAKHWTDNWAKDGWSQEEMVARTHQTLNDLIGTGEGSDLIRAALKNDGKVSYTFAGEEPRIIRIGSKDFTRALDEMKASGKWTPGIRIIPNAGMRFLPEEKTGILGALSKMRDFMFRWGYSNPDLAMSRSPLFRRIALRELRNMQAAGYDTERAVEIARQIAAEQTADIMFEIGAHTTGEHFLKTFNPFFPAWRELTDTWLIRIPSRLGGLGEEALLPRLIGWGAGQARLAHWANIFHDAALETGFLERDADGNLVVPVQFLAPVLNKLFGTDINYKVRFPLQSMFGIFPIPLDLFSNDPSKSIAERGFGFLPTLGAPATWTLGQVEKLVPGLTPINEFVAPYGIDPSGSAANVDYIGELLGITNPLANGSTKSYMDQMKMASVTDGIRIYTRDNPVPPAIPKGWDKMKGPEQDLAMTKYQNEVLGPYWEAAIKYGKDYSTRVYIAKAMFSTFLPVSMQWTDEGAQQLADMWESLSAFRGSEVGNRVMAHVINAFKAEHPDLEAYWTGKYWDTRTGPYNPNEDYNDWHIAVTSGKIQAKTPEDLMTILMGQGTENFLDLREQSIRAEAMNSANPMYTYLMDKDFRKRLDAIQAEKSNYLDWMHEEESKLPGATNTYWALRYKMNQLAAAKNNDIPNNRLTNGLSFRQENLLKFDSIRKQFDKIVALDPAASDNYYKVTQQLYSRISKLYDSKDPFMNAVGWFYQHVNGPYWEHAAALYDQVDGTEPADKALIYNKIRNLADRHYAPITHDGYTFPSPELYQYANWTTEEQNQHVAKWASLPAEYLTQFQREQVGYSLTPTQQDNASKLSNYAFKADRALGAWLQAHGKTYDEKAAAQADAAVARYANELGLGQYWNEAKQPEYVRIGTALHLSQRTPVWNLVSGWATTLRNQIIAAGFQPGGGGTMAQAAYASFLDSVHSLHSPEFDAIMKDMSVALGSNGEALAPDQTLLKLFFGVYR